MKIYELLKDSTTRALSSSQRGQLLCSRPSTRDQEAPHPLAGRYTSKCRPQRRPQPLANSSREERANPGFDPQMVPLPTNRTTARVT